MKTRKQTTRLTNLACNSEDDKRQVNAILQLIISQPTVHDNIEQQGDSREDLVVRDVILLHQLQGRQEKNVTSLSHSLKASPYIPHQNQETENLVPLVQEKLTLLLRHVKWIDPIPTKYLQQ